MKQQKKAAGLGTTRAAAIIETIPSAKEVNNDTAKLQ